MDLSAAFNRPVSKTHAQRERFLKSRKRFDVIPAGRRSGKTYEARWRLIAGTIARGGPHHGCLTPPPGVKDPTFVYAAPTYAQAKRIVWNSFKEDIPSWAISKLSESELTIQFITGARLMVVGMDRPERVEGIAIDGVVLDEFADMNPLAWTSSIRPALSTIGRPPGWALFIGRPRGKNHFYKVFQESQRNSKWGCYYPWPSWAIMSEEEIADARKELDELSFRQEYGGEFVESANKAYHCFSDEHNCIPLEYQPDRPLLIGLDYNVNPGVAVICQDQDLVVEVTKCASCGFEALMKSGDHCPACRQPAPHEYGVGVIGEVFRWNVESNTKLVCQEIVETWGDIHRGQVICYGDATGGARRTSSDRSDWQIVQDSLVIRWPDLELDISRANPNVRDRIVMMNSKFRSASGSTKIFIDKAKCPNLFDDLEATTLKQNGDLNPGPEHKWTHISDALGYLVVQRYGNSLFSNSFEDDDFGSLV